MLSAEQPQQHRTKKKKPQARQTKGSTLLDFSPTRISHKQLSQFLRERHKALKDLKDEIFNRHLNLQEMASGLVL
ncbi:hypothetical protein CK203_041409 [Vitis vinifera]|uniref:Uncharacterized protein n=1 Tax=Vitis vinifera TaxID=29760 RepID=A0A438H6K2_VITVI|nr:hypothetical protein CK203_041409 [Vitis vinifera]